MSSTADRRTDVLRAIVSDYIASHEPVGSKSLVERHALGVSSATIRNDMAVLEAEGYIVQPHTSSGRIPTEKGYRHFVDSIEQITPLSTAQRRAIRAFLEGAVDLDDVLRRAVRLLAQLTQQVAVVQYPVLGRSTVRHLEVVSLAPARLLLVLITDTGDLTVHMEVVVPEKLDRKRRELVEQLRRLDGDTAEVVDETTARRGGLFSRLRDAVAGH